MAAEIDIGLEGGRRTTAVRYTPETPRTTDAPVILAHGAGAGQRHPFIAGVARHLAAAGIEVVTFNFPYREERRRVPDASAVLEQCFRRVIACVRAGRTETAVFAGGKSMGGRIATQVAAHGEPLAGVFALGYPLHPPGKPHQLRSAHLPAITVPVLIVQGERDPFGTPGELGPVVDAMRAPVRLDVVAAGDHSLGVRGIPSEQLYGRLGAAIAEWVRTTSGWCR